MPKEAIELLLFFVLLFKSGFQSSDYCWNTDSGKLEVNNRKPRKYCLKGFYKGINSKSKRSDTASLTWSVLLPSYKDKEGNSDRISGDFPGGIKKLVTHHIFPHPPNANYLQRKCRAPSWWGEEMFCFVFF